MSTVVAAGTETEPNDAARPSSMLRYAETYALRWQARADGVDVVFVSRARAAGEDPLGRLEFVARGAVVEVPYRDASDPGRARDQKELRAVRDWLACVRELAAVPLVVTFEGKPYVVQPAPAPVDTGEPFPVRAIVIDQASKAQVGRIEWRPSDPSGKATTSLTGNDKARARILDGVAALVRRR